MLYKRWKGRLLLFLAVFFAAVLFFSQAAAAGEVWKCTQKLNTPTGYNGGLIRLELVQNVGGAPKASSVVEGQQLTFPYQLDITGAPGVAEGTLYLSEQQSDGSYQELGHYPLTFEKVE